MTPSFDILSLSLPFLSSCWRSTLRDVVETLSRSVRVSLAGALFVLSLTLAYACPVSL